jgi:hypothetical protein
MRPPVAKSKSIEIVTEKVIDAGVAAFLEYEAADGEVSLETALAQIFVAKPLGPRASSSDQDLARAQAIVRGSHLVTRGQPIARDGPCR